MKRGQYQRKRRLTCSVPGCNQPRRDPTGSQRFALCERHWKERLKQYRKTQKANQAAQRMSGAQSYSVADVYARWGATKARPAPPSPVYYGDVQVWGIVFAGSYRLLLRGADALIMVPSTARLYSIPESEFGKRQKVELQSVSC